MLKDACQLFLLVFGKPLSFHLSESVNQDKMLMIFYQKVTYLVVVAYSHFRPAKMGISEQVALKQFPISMPQVQFYTENGMGFYE